MAKIWTILYENALHADSSELLDTIREASNAMHLRLRELGKSKAGDDVREKSAIYGALADLYVLSNCGQRVQA